MIKFGPATFRDHFASIFQSTITEVGQRITSQPLKRTRALTPQAADRDDFAEVASDLMTMRSRGEPAPVVAESSQRSRSFNITSTTKACATLAWRYMEARLAGDGAKVAQLEGEFKAGTCDPAWFSTVTEYLRFFGPFGERREIPYISPVAAGEGVIRIKSNARIALLADWGTGSESALDVLRQIKALKPDILIHLGDVYYSGTPEEYQQSLR